MASTDPPPSTAVVEEVGETVGTPPTELPPLFEAIDPDGLDVVVDSLEDGEVSFAYCGHRITVEENGTITIEEDGS